MNVTWRQQIVAFCVLLVARMFADDPQLVQDLKNLSNQITHKATEPQGSGATARSIRPVEEFQVTSTPTT